VLLKPTCLMPSSSLLSSLPANIVVRGLDAALYGAEDIANVFWTKQVCIISSITLLPYLDPSGEILTMAFVHVDQWLHPGFADLHSAVRLEHHPNEWWVVESNPFQVEFFAGKHTLTFHKTYYRFLAHQHTPTGFLQQPQQQQQQQQQQQTNGENSSRGLHDNDCDDCDALWRDIMHEVFQPQHQPQREVACNWLAIATTTATQMPMPKLYRA
jgi:hypothetical protein